MDLDSRPLWAAWSSVACVMPLLHVKAHGPALSETSIAIGLSLSSWKRACDFRHFGDVIVAPIVLEPIASIFAIVHSFTISTILRCHHSHALVLTHSCCGSYAVVAVMPLQRHTPLFITPLLSPHPTSFSRYFLNASVIIKHPYDSRSPLPQPARPFIVFHLYHLPRLHSSFTLLAPPCFFHHHSHGCLSSLLSHHSPLPHSHALLRIAQL